MTKTSEAALRAACARFGLRDPRVLCKVAEDSGLGSLPRLDKAEDPDLQAQREAWGVHDAFESQNLIDPTSSMPVPSTINRLEG